MKDHRPEQLERGVDHRTHRRPVALPDRHQAEPLEDLDRFTDRRPVHAELVRQLALGRQLPSGGEAPVEDRVPQLLGDVFVETAPGGGAKRDDRHGPGSYPMVQPIVNG